MIEASTKKRKQSNTDVDVPTKKSKKEMHVRQDSKLKGKERETEFHLVKTSVALSIPPIFSSNPRAGVDELLDSMVMRYIPALRGVVLSHANMRFLSDTANIKWECPFLVCKVEFNATVWCPRIGMRLVGKVNLFSPDHVSLLLHRTFNVSIPRHHIPKGEWEFEYGPAENDPEFGPDVDQDANGVGLSLSKDAGDGGGKWVHHITNEKLGGHDGFLEFTVIGLTAANEMLSLLGSIQSDPFSLEHVPETGKREQAESDAEGQAPQHDPNAEEEDDEDEIETDEDTFKALGKKTEEVVAAEAAARRKAEALALEEKEKKRKRKAEKAEEKRTKR